MLDLGRNHWIDEYEQRRKDEAEIEELYNNASRNGRVKTIVVPNIYRISKELIDAWKRKGVQITQRP